MNLGPFEPDSIVVGDCVDVLAQLPDGCADLVFCDPPYNLRKADWDSGHDWRTWLAEVVRVLAFNGALWVIHGDPLELGDISRAIVEAGGPPLINWVTWDKYNAATGDKGFMDGFTVPEFLRSFQQMGEFLIYHAMTATDANQYTQGGRFIFEPLRAYLAGEWKRAGLTFEDARQAVGCADGSGLPSHWFTRSQWALPTAEKYQQLRDYANTRNSGEYLRREYEDLRPTFNNPGKVSSVWPGPPAKKNGHETPKPEWLLRRIIEATTNPGDVVLDIFMGSGTTAAVAKQTGRHYFGCDIGEEYVKLARERVAKIDGIQMPLSYTEMED